MARTGERTRERMLDAAEQLFASRGIDAVTNAEITEAAGQKNNSAISYHFGDRAGLLDAVLRRHVDQIDRRRDELLEALHADATLGEVVKVMVLPLSERLLTSSGCAYLRLQASVLHREVGSGLTEFVIKPSSRSGLGELRRRIAEAAPEVWGHGAELRAQFTSTLLFHALAEEAREPHDDIKEFTTQLSGALTALLRADLTGKVIRR